ncbi:M28 family peptidase [Pseudonocardia sp. TRM90224]|uniref:M28 family peptidase n=1 Tax=Pseudonocardia sp. TRM90224 TaxID=2812678 RepID=UPI001E442536|nr:M28 family peptidase [Pseudonocardia sp. TRM90224]
MAPTAFFDIGDTLGAVRLTAAGTGIADIVPFPGVVDVLRELRDGGVRMGILSNRGSIPAADVEAALDAAGLLTFFDPALIVYGRKDNVQVFESAAALVAQPRDLLFVGEDANERWFARAADFRVCPHPRLAPRMLLGRRSPLRFLRIRVPIEGADWRARLRGFPIVPLHAGSGSELYAIGDNATALELDDLGLWVDRLGADGEPDTSELYLLRDDGRTDAVATALDGGPAGGGAAALFADDSAARRVLASTREGLYIALPAGRSVESLHVGSARHGHNLKLAPVPALLDAPAADGLRAADAEFSAAALTAAEILVVRREVSATRVAREVGRYSGSRALRTGTTLRSRHIDHPDNAVAVDALVADLTAMGLAVRRHRFTHGGRSFHNVEAVSAGSGPSGAVLVTAHLDSTAARAAGYRAAIDPAPGADDDASGIAAVLTAARGVLALDTAIGTPRREIRFVLFNAEEQGLVGSRAYARDEAARAAAITAVLQMDMIGHDAAPGRAFELHAGFTPSAVVQKRSVALAELVATVVPRVSTLPGPQIYPGNGAPDPAEQRSDHFSFQLHGYAACLASEDFFAGPAPTSPAPDANPNYHLPTDTTVSATYARDITRAVTAAAWLCGTR